MRERRSALGERYEISAFDLFCAYHLGITAEGDYCFQNVHQVARRFNVNAGVIRQVLDDYEMDSDTVINSKFDMAGAQVDIMVAPKGVDRFTLARPMYEEFLRAPRKARDWVKELAQDARDNEKIFGR